MENNEEITGNFFCLLFGYPIANFGPLLKEHPHSDLITAIYLYLT